MEERYFAFQIMASGFLLNIGSDLVQQTYNSLRAAEILFFSN
jgi:hypothetical protein